MNLNRRSFLAAASIGALGCASSPSQSPTAASATPGSFELDEATFADLLSRQQSGELTAVSTVQLYLERIAAIDRDGPGLHSVIQLNPDAEAIAAELDRARANGEIRGPLHGLPILIKDNIDTADRMQTTAGSLALEGSIAPADSGVAAALRKAGAVILGKTNLSEWANFRSFDSTSGWSGRGGLTHNPYVLDRNACGSSSGSGVAASANLCAAAIGTETNGSITCPSSINGLVGIKPTVGLVSQSGIIPISATQDTAGPMARTVRDAAILLGAIVDPAAVAPSGGLTDYTGALAPGALRGARIGVGRPFSGLHDDFLGPFESALEALQSAGADLIELSDGVDRERLGDAPLALMLFEFKEGLNRYLSGLKPEVTVRSLADVIAFNSAHPQQELPYFDQGILELAQEKGGLDEEEYQNALRVVPSVHREAIDQALQRFQLDAIVAPTTGPAWVTDLVHGDHSSGGSSSAAARAGYPNVTVPAGFIQGLPVGISFFGTAWSEARLLALAYDFEQRTSVRRKPEFRALIG